MFCNHVIFEKSSLLTQTRVIHAPAVKLTVQLACIELGHSCNKGTPINSELLIQRSLSMWALSNIFNVRNPTHQISHVRP